MNKARAFLGSPVVTIYLVPLARLFLGVLFIYMGLNKTAHPVEFLKLVREYNLTENALLLNLVAALLPWFEIFTGLMLILGIGVRGATLLAAGMLIPFTYVVAQRATFIHQAQGIPFCGISFDCGCGSGEVLICRKIAENVSLILLALFVVCVRAPRGCLRYDLFRQPMAPRGDLGNS